MFGKEITGWPSALCLQQTLSLLWSIQHSIIQSFVKKPIYFYIFCLFLDREYSGFEIILMDGGSIKSIVSPPNQVLIGGLCITAYWNFEEHAS